MNAKRNQAKLAKHLPKDHPALRSIHVDKTNLIDSMSWYSEHPLVPEIKQVLDALDKPAAAALAEYYRSLLTAAKEEADDQIDSDAITASECYLMYMLLTPLVNHLPWLASNATHLLRGGIVYYQELMNGVVAICESTTERQVVLSLLYKFVETEE
jgi:hypothetical protein